MAQSNDNAKILLVEDEVLVSTDLASRLKGLGYTICGQATNGEKALELVEQYNPNLVMMDIVLQGKMDGIKVADVIRKKWGIPVVFTTAYADTDQLKRAKMTYPFGYILKPIQDKELKITTEMALYVAKVEAERRDVEESLEQSELWLRSTFDALEDAVLVVTPDRKLVDINRGAKKIFGYSKDELCRLSTEVLHVDCNHFTDFGRKINEAFSRGETAEFEFYAKRKNGEIFPSEHSVSLIKNSSGESIGIVSVVRDITERKKTEQALENALRGAERQTKELQLLLNGAKIVLEGRDFPSTAKRIFDAACEMTGAVSGYVALLSDDGEENEVLFLESGGLPCSVDESLPMPIRGLRAEAYTTQKSVYDNDFMNSPWVDFMPEGHVGLRNVLFAPLNIESKTAGIMGLANKPEDFTDDDLRIASAFGQLVAIALKNSRTLEALTESQAIIQAAMDNSQAGIAIADAPDGKLRYVNKAGFFIRGGSKEDLVNDIDIEQYVSSWKILHLDGRPYEPDEVPLARAVKFGEICSKEFIIRRSAMDDRIVLANAAPIRNDSGRVVAGIVVFHDITELRESEKEREKLNTQLQQAQKMEAIGTLAGGVSHDFNNLLQAINGYTQILLMDKSENDPEYSSLTAILNSGRRASELVRSLLLFSRKAETERKPIELNIEIERARNILEHTIPKMVDIHVLHGGRLWPVLADPVQVEQILLNLGSNAADAMPDGGKLIIETANIMLSEDVAMHHSDAQAGRYVLLTISDTGHGMDKETQEKMFEPFFTTKEFGKGTGLGLASVYGIIKSHGGCIVCNSEVGRGTTFKIYLPAMEQATIDQEKDIVADTPRGGSETILLVDDEEAIRNLAQQALMKFGYKVFISPSGEEALDFYKNRPGEIDLVITDIGMPGMGGYKFLQKLFQISPMANVLIASGYAITGQVKKSIEAGAKGYVGKPYQLRELLGNVRNILDGKE